MRSKEECAWCVSTQNLERRVEAPMPEEFKFRCSACHEQWAETHIECDVCHKVVDLDAEVMHHDRLTDVYSCNECKDKHGYI